MKEVHLEKPDHLSEETPWPAGRLVFELDDNLVGAVNDRLETHHASYLAIITACARENKIHWQAPEYPELMPRFFRAALPAVKGIRFKDSGEEIPRESWPDVIEGLGLTAKELLANEVVKANERDLGNVLDSLSSSK